MTPTDPIPRLAGRYLWWLKAPETASQTDRLILQVMDIGDFDDTRELLRHVGADRFRSVLRHAQAGQLRPKSWAYWHYRLGLTKTDETPPRMPERVFR